MEVRIGVDDTDSVRGMCTTYLAYVMARKFDSMGATFLEYPRLVRLNPNIPWKTRGNGAVSLHVETDHPDKIWQATTRMIEQYADDDANPGAVLLEGNGMTPDMTRLARRALWDVVSIRDALQAARGSGARILQKGTGRGIIGAMSAIGYRFCDSTAELIAYRDGAMVGSPRRIQEGSVAQMQECTYPDTFSSYDTTTGRVLICPRGPDPVFYGLRGESPYTVWNASRMIGHKESLQGHMIFRTNQGTGEHLYNMLDAENLRPHTSGLICGSVAKRGLITAGGHCKLAVQSGSSIVSCWVYKPTGLAGIASRLEAGDRVVVGGGIRAGARGHTDTLSVEMLRVVQLAPVTSYKNPGCAKCRKSMKSQGRGQGYLCVRCGARFPYRIPLGQTRSIRVGEYVSAVGAQRHLSRPEQRRGRTNRIRFDATVPWLAVYSGE